MCGRFFLVQSRFDLESLLDVAPDRDSIDDASLQLKFNLPPAYYVPGVVVASDGKRSLDLYRWGFIPNWVVDISAFKLTTINARAESIATAPTYRSAFRSQRVLIPATGFYEWDRSNPKNKQPHAFVRNDGAPVVFAGLWDAYRHRDDFEGERWIRTCTIVTTQANADMPIHNRLPLVLENDSWERWLDPQLTDLHHLEQLVRVAAPGVLRHYPIDRRVGTVKFDNPMCIEPVELVEEQTLL